jgi:hypothetical protein
VLLVLLSILVLVKSRARLLLFGAMFVVASGVVYFLFMTAWMELFSLAGLSRAITVLLGLVVLAMGLVNLKELLWFKKGVSLMIPDRAKPGLFRRMRAIAHSVSLPAALAGIAALAFLVNLIELGCTLGCRRCTRASRSAPICPARRGPACSRSATSPTSCRSRSSSSSMPPRCTGSRWGGGARRS